MLLASWAGALGGCGDPAAPADGGRLAQFAAARGMAVTPPPGPAAHLRGLGVAAFSTPQGAIEQDLELWVAGPQRGRWALTSGGNQARNLFLLDGAEAWLSRGAAKWDAYAAQELAAECALRWELTRFPWGWQEIIRDAPADAQGFARPAAQGELTIQVDAEGRPVAGAYAGVAARITAWSATAGRALPTAWSWQTPSGSRTESFTEFRDDARFFDEAFRPEAAATTAHTPGDAGERLGVIEATLWRTPRPVADGGMDAPSWWRVAEQRVAAVLLPAGAPAPAPDATAEDAQRWLRWSFLGTARDARDAAAQLEAVARSAGLTPLGPPWLRTTAEDDAVRGQIVALPVR